MSVSRIYRLLRLITMLQSGRSYTADELATDLEISRRTVFRDLNMLEMAHIPYYFDEDRGGYRISQHFFLPPVNLTLPEALSMLVLTGRMRESSGLPLLAHGRMAAIKLESALPEAIRQHLGSILDRVSFSISPVSRHKDTEDLFDRLMQAVTSQKVCRIAYLSFKDRKYVELEVHPLRLVFKSRAWYVIAYSVTHEEVRTFKLIRISKLSLTGRTFKAHAVDLDKHFGEAWSMIPEGKLYDVHIRFGKQVAGNVAEVQWHPNQRVQWNDDGTIDFRVRVDGLGEITWWILGYGDQAEVLAPPELRRRIAEVASSLVRQYARAESN